MISRPAIGDARCVVARVTRDALDDDAHSVEPGTRLVGRERRTGPELVGAIVHDDGLAPALLDEDAVFECHKAVGLAPHTGPKELATPHDGTKSGKS